MRQAIQQFPVLETSTEHGNKRKGRLPDADGRNLLFAAYFDNAVGDAFGLHLYDFAPQFGRQLEMIRQITLVCQWDAVDTFAGRLHVEDKELRVVAGSQPGSLADDLSRRLLLTADASQEFFMPDTCIDGDRALHLLFDT